MSEQCLELKNVCKSFRDFTLNNIDFAECENEEGVAASSIL